MPFPFTDFVFYTFVLVIHSHENDYMLNPVSLPSEFLKLKVTLGTPRQTWLYKKRSLRHTAELKKKVKVQFSVYHLLENKKENPILKSAYPQHSKEADPQGTWMI